MQQCVIEFPIDGPHQPARFPLSDLQKAHFSGPVARIEEYSRALAGVFGATVRGPPEKHGVSARCSELGFYDDFVVHSADPRLPSSKFESKFLDGLLTRRVRRTIGDPKDSSTETRAYDLLKRTLVIAETYGAGGIRERTATQQFQFGEDGLARRWSMADPNPYSVEYEYDAHARLSRAHDSRGVTRTYKYDAKDSLMAVTIDGNREPEWFYENTYDTAGRLVRIAVRGSGEEKSVYSLAYGSDGKLALVHREAQTFPTERQHTTRTLDGYGNVVETLLETEYTDTMNSKRKPQRLLCSQITYR